MKKIAYLLIILLPLVIISCTKREKQQELCKNVNCGVHGNCVDGVCQCDSNWVGEHCDSTTIICQQNHTGIAIIVNHFGEPGTVHVNSAPQGRIENNESIAIQMNAGENNVYLFSDRWCTVSQNQIRCPLGGGIITVRECQSDTFVFPQ